MQFNEWKEDILSVTEMTLDEKNYRLPRSGLTERELVGELILHDKADELAFSIAQNGYFPTERLIVIKEDGKNVVVEGNRRLAALKALLEISLVPDPMKTKFQKMPTIDLGITKHIPVLFAPSREEANKVIVHKHTEAPFLAWEPLMKARFYRDLIEQGETVDSISEKYKIARVDIIEFLKTDDIYTIAKNLELEQSILEKVRDERKFPISTLMDRLISNAKVRQFLGIDFNDKGNVIGKIKKEEFEKGFKKIITDIALREEDSRSLNKETDVLDYLKKFGNKKPNSKKKGIFTSNDFVKENKIVEAKFIKKIVKKSRKKPAGLIPSGIPFKLNNTSLQNIFIELRDKIVTKKTPHATAVLFRSFLQMSITQYLKEKKLLDKVEKRKTDRQPTLDELLKFILDDNSPIQDNAAKQAVKKAKSETDKIFSLDSMHAITHNQDISIDENDVRKIWSNFEGLTKIILSGE